MNKFPSRVPFVLYKGLLRRAQIFDRYPILKAYSTDPFKNTLYVPSYSFVVLIKEVFRLKQTILTLSQGFALYRDWNDVYSTVSQKITWFNRHPYTSIEKSSIENEPKAKHIQNIIPGSVLVSHPAVFDRNFGSEIVLILQCREDDIMGLVIQGTDLGQLSPSSKREEVGINNEQTEKKTDMEINIVQMFDKLENDVELYDNDNIESYFENKIYSRTDIDEDEEEKELEGEEIIRIDMEEEEDVMDQTIQTTRTFLFRKNDLLQANHVEDDSCYYDKTSETNIDDGRGEINPKLVNESITKESAPEINKVIYRGGARFPNKYVVLYKRPNEGFLEGEILSDDLYFTVFNDLDSMKASKIVTLPSNQYRIFQGYQLFNTPLLKKDVSDGTYIVSYAPLDVSQICHSDLDQPVTLTTEEIWSNILASMGGEFCSFAYSRSPMIEKERKEVTLE